MYVRAASPFCWRPCFGLCLSVLRHLFADSPVLAYVCLCCVTFLLTEPFWAHLALGRKTFPRGTNRLLSSSLPSVVICDVVATKSSIRQTNTVLRAYIIFTTGFNSWLTLLLLITQLHRRFVSYFSYKQSVFFIQGFVVVGNKTTNSNLKTT